MEQQGLGSVPALSKRFFFPMVKGGKDRLRTFLFKIVGCQHTQIEKKITWAVLPWAITGINISAFWLTKRAPSQSKEWHVNY